MTAPSPRKRPAVPFPAGAGKSARLSPAAVAGERAAAAPTPAAAAPRHVPGAAVVGEGHSRPLGTNPVADAMSENELDEHIRRILADLPNVLRYHTFDSRKSPSGYPDLTLCGPGGVLYRELKRQGKKPTPSQDEWLCALTDAGANAGVWRPADLLDGTIARELAAISGLKVPWPAGARRARGGAGITEGRGEPA